MFYKDIHKYLHKYFSTSFMPAKDYKQSLWEGEGTKEKNQNKTNQKFKLTLPLQVYFNKPKRCQETYLLVTVLIFPQSQCLETTDQVQKHPYMVKRGWRRDTKITESTVGTKCLLTSFCTSLGCMSNTESDRCHSKQNVLWNTGVFLWEMWLWAFLAAPASAIVFTDLQHTMDKQPHWAVTECCVPVPVTASRRRESSERCIQINGLNKVIFKVYFEKLAF